MKLEKSEPNFSSTLKGPCIYLLMGLNDYLGLLVEVDGATLISTILLVDVKVGSFPPYIYVPPLGKAHQDYHMKSL